MYRPVNMEEKKGLYMHLLEAYARDKFLEFARAHGNGLWAFETLEYHIYVENIDKYERLNEDEKFILNSFMKSFRSLYK